MPGFPDLTDDAVRALVAYLRDTPGHGEMPELRVTKPSGRLRFTGYKKFLDPDGYPAVAPPWGTLSAIDLNTGAYAWKIPLGEYPELVAQGLTDTGSENYGGPIVTAGGLLFIGATNFDQEVPRLRGRDRPAAVGGEAAVFRQYHAGHLRGRRASIRRWSPPVAASRAINRVGCSSRTGSGRTHREANHGGDSTSVLPHGGRRRGSSCDDGPMGHGVASRGRASRRADLQLPRADEAGRARRPRHDHQRDEVVRPGRVRAVVAADRVVAAGRPRRSRRRREAEGPRGHAGVAAVDARRTTRGFVSALPRPVSRSTPTTTVSTNRSPTTRSRTASPPRRRWARR